jgi:hypothetical protein
MRKTYTTMNIPTDVVETLDAGRGALARTSGVMSRPAFVAAAIEHYVAALSEKGYDVPEIGDVESIEDLAGVKMPFRPRADYAIVNDERTPNAVQLAVGQGPGGAASLRVVAELLPHHTRGRYGGWRAMLHAAGYAVDETRETETVSDGRAIIPITKSGPHRATPTRG